MNLLIVDDEVITTEVLRENLDRERLGIDEIYTAYDACGAREILQRAAVELLLCDIEMPGESGLSLFSWVREHCAGTECVFLTSHEKFEYAVEAVRTGAANYLVKPIDLQKINNALFAVTERIRKRKQLERMKSQQSYGRRKLQQDFWRRLLQGRTPEDPEQLRRELELVELGIDLGEHWRLLLFRVNPELLEEPGSRRAYQFILENTAAELFTPDINMERVVSWEGRAEIEYYMALASQYAREELQERCSRLQETLKMYGGGLQHALLAGYISEECRLTELAHQKTRMQEFDGAHVYDDGEIIFFEERRESRHLDGNPLDGQVVLQYLEKGERVRLLEYLQSVLSENRKNHSLAYMQYFQLELTRMIDIFLWKHQLDAGVFISDEGYMKMRERALTSELGMIRWCAGAVNKAFDEIRDRETGKGVADVLIDYIRQHYTEPISRAELADLVHFSPEYVGKVFKKEVGLNINDYIHTLRTDRAKQLLRTTNRKITEIALDLGYENMPYFSATFKRYAGVSPAEYKRRCRQDGGGGIS